MAAPMGRAIQPKPEHLTIGPITETLAARKALRPTRPGVERWPVKTGTDQDVQSVMKIGAGFVKATVEQLINEPRPRDMLPVNQAFPEYQDRRAFGVETTIYQVDVTIIAYKEESDGDYHLVIQGSSGHTMIAECPNPDPAYVNPQSPWAQAIGQVRDALNAQLNPAPTMSLQQANVHAVVTGVGFFDRVHNQDGVATNNGIELHPILAITFA